MKPIRLTMATSAVLYTLLDLTQQDGETYGWEVGKEAGLPTGVVYPILQRLESAGYLTSRWGGPSENTGQRGSRRCYYRFTPDGADQARNRLGVTVQKKEPRPA